MKTFSIILTVKQQKISALLSSKTDKQEYLTSEEILPSNQSQVVKQAKFTYSPFEKKSNLRHRSKINYKFVCKGFFN